MQFLISVLDDTTNSATPDEMAAIDAFNDRRVAGGHLPRQLNRWFSRP